MVVDSGDGVRGGNNYGGWWLGMEEEKKWCWWLVKEIKCNLTKMLLTILHIKISFNSQDKI